MRSRTSPMGGPAARKATATGVAAAVEAKAVAPASTTPPPGLARALAAAALQAAFKVSPTAIPSAAVTGVPTGRCSSTEPAYAPESANAATPVRAAVRLKPRSTWARQMVMKAAGGTQSQTTPRASPSSSSASSSALPSSPSSQVDVCGRVPGGNLGVQRTTSCSSNVSDSATAIKMESFTGQHGHVAWPDPSHARPILVHPDTGVDPAVAFAEPYHLLDGTAGSWGPSRPDLLLAHGCLAQDHLTDCGVRKALEGNKDLPRLLQSTDFDPQQGHHTYPFVQPYDHVCSGVIAADLGAEAASPAAQNESGSSKAQEVSLEQAAASDAALMLWPDPLTAAKEGQDSIHGDSVAALHGRESSCSGGRVNECARYCLFPGSCGGGCGDAAPLEHAELDRAFLAHRNAFLYQLLKDGMELETAERLLDALTTLSGSGTEEDAGGAAAMPTVQDMRAVEPPESTCIGARPSLQANTIAAPLSIESSISCNVPQSQMPMGVCGASEALTSQQHVAHRDRVLNNYLGLPIMSTSEEAPRPSMHPYAAVDEGALGTEVMDEEDLSASSDSQKEDCKHEAISRAMQSVNCFQNDSLADKDSSSPSSNIFLHRSQHPRNPPLGPRAVVCMKDKSPERKSWREKGRRKEIRDWMKKLHHHLPHELLTGNDTTAIL